MKRYLFYLFILLAVGMLIIFALSSKKKSNAIIASVESQKTAISFRKPVQVKAIHVNPGQHVSKGDLLLEVERPDLLMERQELENRKQGELGKRKGLLASNNSKLRLLDIEVDGKIQRLETDIARLETEIRSDRTLYENIRNLANGDTTKNNSLENPDIILLNSYREEIENLNEYKASERLRFKIQLEEDLQNIDLQMDLIHQKMEALKMEEATLRQEAPFDGTIGNVNAQLMELVPPYQTIITVYEQLPSTITAFVNLASGNILRVGQKVSVESASRNYSSSGEVIEIGSRIVDYKDPSSPPTAIPLFGKEVFIKLPPENSFLYGEQVFVYIPKE